VVVAVPQEEGREGEGVVPAMALATVLEGVRQAEAQGAAGAGLIISTTIVRVPRVWAKREDALGDLCGSSFEGKQRKEGKKEKGGGGAP
jgi:hypothetical protein